VPARSRALRGALSACLLATALVGCRGDHPPGGEVAAPTADRVLARAVDEVASARTAHYVVSFPYEVATIRVDGWVDPAAHAVEELSEVLVYGHPRTSYESIRVGGRLYLRPRTVLGEDCWLSLGRRDLATVLGTDLGVSGAPVAFAATAGLEARGFDGDNVTADVDAEDVAMMVGGPRLAAYLDLGKARTGTVSATVHIVDGHLFGWDVSLDDALEVLQQLHRMPRDLRRLSGTLSVELGRLDEPHPIAAPDPTMVLTLREALDHRPHGCRTRWLVQAAGDVLR
jgi:hypothetical protein